MSFYSEKEGLEPERAACVEKTAWLLFSASWSEPEEQAEDGRHGVAAKSLRAHQET